MMIWLVIMLIEFRVHFSDNPRDQTMQLNHLDPEPMVTCSPSGDFTDVGPPSLFFPNSIF